MANQCQVLKWCLAHARAQVGSLTSLFPIAYGFSKFVSGVLGARTSPTLMLSFGLMATAAVNLLFGAGNAMPWFMTFWAINGILQARRLPASCKSVRRRAQQTFTSHTLTVPNPVHLP